MYLMANKGFKINIKGWIDHSNLVDETGQNLNLVVSVYHERRRIYRKSCEVW